MDMSQHPTSAAPALDPRERIVAALRQRAGDAPAPSETPNLPALITALPGDHTRAPQTEFDRARQVLFLENLSITGSVRSAASAAQVSHQTAYRARRGTGAFRTAWDAALVVARAQAEGVLASRAIDGLEEKVFYHGEEIATRRRYSDRLLLAHLARLDRLSESADATAFADDFDAALARYGAGEAAVVSAAEKAPETPEKLSPEPCNTRSMSNKADNDWDDDEIDWEDEEAAEAEIARIHAAMEADRPADAPRLDLDDPNGAIADAQFQAFEKGVPRWWLVVPPAPFGGEGEWTYAGEEEDENSEEDEEDFEAEDAGDEDELRAEEADDCDAAPAFTASAVQPEPQRPPETVRPRYTWNGPSEGATPYYGRGY